MRKFWSLFNARNKEFYRDRGSLGWNFIFPMVIILGFGFGYSGKNQDLFKVGIHRSAGATDAPVASFLQTRYVQFIPFDQPEQALHKIRRHQIDLYLDLDGGRARYWINSNSPKGYAAEKLLLASATDPARLEKQTVEGHEIRYVEWLLPGILAMNMMFSSLFGVGYAIVRYRKNGVLKRLKATPVTAFEFLTAQLASRLILILLTSAIVFAGALLLIRLEMAGSYLALLAYFALSSACMISLSLVVASRIASEELAEGLLNLMTWPMMLLSSAWFSIEGASPFVVAASKCLPLTYVVSGARAIIIDGASLSSLMPEIAALAAFTAVFLAIGAAIFKWN